MGEENQEKIPAHRHNNPAKHVYLKSTRSKQLFFVFVFFALSYDAHKEGQLGVALHGILQVRIRYQIDICPGTLIAVLHDDILLNLQTV